jgi:predicted permease
MSLVARFRSFLTALLSRRRLERDIEEEWRFHVAARADSLAADGVPREEAERRARVEFGDPFRWKELSRDVRGVRWIEDLIADFKYGLRQLRRAPLFAASVATTIGLGLGVFTSAFTILNAYVLRPVDLPNPYQLYALNWDTATERQHRFALADFEALREGAPFFSGLVATEEASVMEHGAPAAGLLVTGNYFQVLGARAAMGRLLMPTDASNPGAGAVVVLSHAAWRSHHGGDPAIVGKEIALGRQRVTVVGVTEPGYGLGGEALVEFWAPLTMARAFGAWDVWSNRDLSSLLVLGRMRPGSSAGQLRVWLDAWLRQRFPAGSDRAPLAVHVESLATLIPLTGPQLTLFSLLMAAFGLVLLMACANVTNLLLARAFGRQQEIAIRLSLGASRWRITRQLLIESLTLAVPASAVGLAFTMVTARVFPSLIVRTFPAGIVPIDAIMRPLEPDVRVMTCLCAAAVTSAVVVTLLPALRLTRANFLGAPKGDSALGGRGSGLRKGLVGLQIGACVLFLVSALGLIDVSRRTVTAKTGLSYEHVLEVTMTRRLRPKVAERLQADPAVARIAAAWRAPFAGPMPPIQVVASRTGIEQTAGFMVVSPEYFPLFDIPIVRGRDFSAPEADEAAAVALVSQATARVLWPGLDPIDQTLDLIPSRVSVRRPAYTSVRVIGVTADVVSGMPTDGVDRTCVYFATSLQTPDALTMLVRGDGDMGALKASVTVAVNAIEPEAGFQSMPMRTVVGVFAWVMQAFSVAALFVGTVGLVLAFSGTYGVVAFIVMQRTREFGIRVALGATAGRIVSDLLGETLHTAALGIGAGVLMAAGLGAVFSSTMPIPVIPKFSILPYLMGTGIVLIATAAAALIPSLRTTRIDPSRALRVD